MKLSNTKYYIYILFICIAVLPFPQIKKGLADELVTPETAIAIENFQIIFRKYSNCILTLEAIAKHIRFRGEEPDTCSASSPESMDIWVNVATLENRFIIRVMANVIRELENVEKKEQAINIIIPLLDDALSGKVADLHPSDALQAYRDSVLDPLYPVIPEFSPQLKSYYSALVRSINSIDTELQSKALLYLLRFAFLVPEKRAEIIQMISSSQPDYTPEKVLFDIGMIASYEEPISAEELDALRNTPLATLATKALEPENMRRLTIYGHLIRQKIKEGDPNSDNARSVLLVALKNFRMNSKDPRVPFALSFAPPPILASGATLEQETTRENFIALMTREVDVTETGESLEWVAFLLQRALDRKRLSFEPESIQATARVTEQGQIYGISCYVRLLETVFYKDMANTNTVRAVVAGLCSAVDMDVNLKDTICILFDQFLSVLAESHPNWDKEHWFIFNTPPDCSQIDNCKDEETYHHIRMVMRSLCAKS